ncbi:sterol desaturase family protein [Puia dinghuensis]|uniref:Fatty acid hydroxylase domain-containing protein n=1 Tax=Puia dinghuensis TaxID=1792502 RepID=A0A8J2UD85_9BACT|nr:sterol desaturase family protein [Puia dinghuensis]GGB00067.1 hypothetical protein GCM10011511_24230 [Puia dinghuensis]
MTLVEKLLNEVTGFFALHNFVDMVRTHDFRALRTMAGIDAIIAPLIPILLVAEAIHALILRRVTAAQYKIPFFSFVFNRVMQHFVSIVLVTWLFIVISPFSPIRSKITWYWLLYSYVVWELAHFIYHYLGHKVRLFWCLHATHHAPEHMNISVTHAHFFLEGPFADVIRTTVCTLLGVNYPLLLFIMFIDTTWGGFIHIGENMIRDGRLGFLHDYILTPSHHRVHHARNPLYMDTNFGNLLPIWDRIFRTYRPEKENITPEYGTTRYDKEPTMLQAYFGEFVALGKDVYHAPGIINKCKYIIMPPGWSHLGDHKTAAAVRRHWLEAQKAGAEEHELEIEVGANAQPKAAHIGVVEVSKPFHKI